jgi:hypothetical protein
MASIYAFNPAYTQTDSISVTTSTSSTACGVGLHSICLTNTTSQLCYARVGPIGTVATATDMPVLGNSQVILTKDIDHTTVAAITPTGTTTLLCTPGEGKL